MINLVIYLSSYTFFSCHYSSVSSTISTVLLYPDSQTVLSDKDFVTPLPWPRLGVSLLTINCKSPDLLRAGLATDKDWREG